MRRKSSIEVGQNGGMSGEPWKAYLPHWQHVDFMSRHCLQLRSPSVLRMPVKIDPQSITPASEITDLRSGHNHAGMYWKLKLTVPFHPKVSYVS